MKEMYVKICMKSAMMMKQNRERGLEKCATLSKNRTQQLVIKYIGKSSLH